MTYATEFTAQLYAGIDTENRDYKLPMVKYLRANYLALLRAYRKAAPKLGIEEIVRWETPEDVEPMRDLRRVMSWTIEEWVSNDVTQLRSELAYGMRALDELARSEERVPRSIRKVYNSSVLIIGHEAAMVHRALNKDWVV